MGQNREQCRSPLLLLPVMLSFALPTSGVKAETMSTAESEAKKRLTESALIVARKQSSLSTRLSNAKSVGKNDLIDYVNHTVVSLDVCGNNGSVVDTHAIGSIN